MDARTLRRLYEASYLSGLTGAEMSTLDVTFDDYYEFLHMLAPEVSRRAAAERSQRTDFRKLAAGMPPDPPRPEVPGLNWTSFEKTTRVDLEKAAIDESSEALELMRVKNVRGWKGLARFSGLRRIQVKLCDTDDSQPTRAPFRLESVDVRMSSLACLRTLLASVDARDVEIGHETEALHLAMLANCSRMRRVIVGAPLVRGVGRLRGQPIEELSIADVPLDGELRETLLSLASTLENLRLDVGRAFLPAELGEVFESRVLRRVIVPSFPALQTEWVDLAVAHPNIAFSFFPFRPQDPKREVMSVEETHRGLDIVKCVKGSKIAYEVAGDLAAVRKGYSGSNEDIEDELRPLARTAKKRVDWRSELDTFVVRTPEVETARWIIDQALDGARSVKKAHSPKPKRDR